MKKQPNVKMIGLFALTGILMFFGAVTLFLGDKIFVKKDNLVVMYFDESVKGLYVGAPVVFKGVEVGRVKKIELITDFEKIEFSIPVFVEIDDSQITAKKTTNINDSVLLHSMVKEGLRASLTTQSILTGQLMIEFKMLPNEPIVLRGEPDEAEIPTVLSPMGALSEGVKDLNIKETISKLNELLESANSNLPVIMSEVSEMVSNINSLVGKNKEAQRETTINNINDTLKNVSDAAKSLRNFADYIERHPEALIRGKSGY